MQPELQKIQKKYKGKNNDTAAIQKMQEETQAVYQKYRCISYRKLRTACDPVPYFDGIIPGNL